MQMRYIYVRFLKFHQVPPRSILFTGKEKAPRFVRCVSGRIAVLWVEAWVNQRVVIVQPSRIM